MYLIEIKRLKRLELIYSLHKKGLSNKDISEYLNNKNLGVNKHLLTYNSGSNKISYKPSHGVIDDEDYLFTTGGVLIPISQSNYYIGESTDYPLGCIE